MWTLCPYVFVWVRVFACLSVDSGALMLKDVSSFLHCTRLLWWHVLGCSDVTHVSLSKIQHRNRCAVLDDQTGTFSLSIVQRSFCFSVSVFLSLYPLCRYMYTSFFCCLQQLPFCI